MKKAEEELKLEMTDSDDIDHESDFHVIRSTRLILTDLNGNSFEPTMNDIETRIRAINVWFAILIGALLFFLSQMMVGAWQKDAFLLVSSSICFSLSFIILIPMILQIKNNYALCSQFLKRTNHYEET